MTDEELFAEARTDEAALVALYRLHARPLLAFCVRRTGGDAELAADLCAETFAALVHSILRGRPAPESVEAWLYGTARNKIADAQRRGSAEARARRRVGLPQLELTDHALERVLEVGGEATAALDTLPVSQRAAVEARVLREESYEAIAAAEQTTAGQRSPARDARSGQAPSRTGGPTMISDDFLADLEREIVLVHRRRQRHSIPVVRFAVVLGVIAAAVLVLAQVVGNGPAERPAPPAGDHREVAPPRNARERAFTMRTGKLLALRVPDPDGGPPWGLRLGTSFSGLTCLQVGRVVNDQLGYLGVAGAANDDGRFHPLPVQSRSTLDCASPDRAGHAFIATRYFGLQRSGRDTGCTPRQTFPGGLPEGIPRPPTPRNPCADSDVRFVSLGLLGPEARTITYPDSDNKTVTEQVDEDGAYLVVRRPLPGEEQGGTLSPGALPTGNAFTAATYADGSQCRPRTGTTTADPECPPRGYLPSRLPVPTEAELATTATAHVEQSTLSGHPALRVSVRFRARRPARDGAFYGLTVHNASCAGNGGEPVTHDVRAGDTVTAHGFVAAPISATTGQTTKTCHGAITGRVLYYPAPKQPSVGGPYTGDLHTAVTVARYQARTP